MPNRFYLINGLVDGVATVIRGQWDTVHPSGTIVISLNAAKSGGAIVARSVEEGTAPNPNAVWVLHGISEKLAAQTISGTLNVILGATASDAAAHYYWRIHAYVAAGDTGTNRGTLVDKYAENLTNQWTTISQSMGFQANISISPVTILEGDRIIVEIGYIARTVTPLARGVSTGRIKQSAPASQIQLTFSTPPAVGSGIIVMMSGHKDTAGMTFGTCTDNRGNAYSIAIAQRRIVTNGESAIIMYYCPRVTSSSGPFTITITSDGVNDHAFEGCAVEVTGLDGGILNPARAGSEVTTVTSTPLAAVHTNLTGEAFVAAFFLRFGGTASIVVETASPAWIQEYEELDGTWNVSNCGEGCTRVKTFADEAVNCRWTTANGANCVTGIAAFTRASATVLAAPSGFGSIFYGAPVGSSDLVIPSTEVGNNAGSINFSQNILLQPQPAQVGHVVIQTAYPTPPPPAQISHLVTQIVQILGPTDASIGHVVIQTVPTVVPPLPDMSGIYYLNPRKSVNHDSHYNSIELKIPDPTIRTALLGE